MNFSTNFELRNKLGRALMSGLCWLLFIAAIWGFCGLVAFIASGSRLFV